MTETCIKLLMPVLAPKYTGRATARSRVTAGAAHTSDIGMIVSSMDNTLRFPMVIRIADQVFFNFVNMFFPYNVLYVLSVRAFFFWLFSLLRLFVCRCRHGSNERSQDHLFNIRACVKMQMFIGIRLKERIFYYFEVNRHFLSRIPGEKWRFFIFRSSDLHLRCKEKCTQRTKARLSGCIQHLSQERR